MCGSRNQDSFLSIRRRVQRTFTLISFWGRCITRQGWQETHVTYDIRKHHEQGCEIVSLWVVKTIAVVFFVTSCLSDLKVCCLSVSDFRSRFRLTRLRRDCQNLCVTTLMMVSSTECIIHGVSTMWSNVQLFTDDISSPDRKRKWICPLALWCSRYHGYPTVCSLF